MLFWESAVLRTGFWRTEIYAPVRRCNDRMAKCYVCEKQTVFGNQVSHSVRRTSRTWKPNLRKVRIDENGTTKSVYVCTSCLRSNKVNRAI
jgi:large subunit ribosomal protein L28